jgi:hypothetical protein
MSPLKPILIATLLLALALPANGQGGPYDLKTMNFDLWCQETQHLAPDRCDQRLPDDEATFEAYRAKVEKYEVPYLKSRENGQQLDRAILHNDPVDNPITQDPAAASQAPTSPGTKPHP